VIGQGGEEGMQWVRVIDGALQEWEAKNRTDGAPSGNQNAAREKTTGCVTPSCFGDRDNQYKQVGGTSSDTGSSSSVTESCFRDDESARGIRRLARDAPDILEQQQVVKRCALDFFLPVCLLCIRGISATMPSQFQNKTQIRLV